MSVDENLLNQSGEANVEENSGEEAAPSGEQKESADTSDGRLATLKGSQEEPKSLREAVQQDKKKKLAQENKKEEGGAKVSAIRQGTNNLLKSAWMNLITSFGLTILWIDIHVFGRAVLGHDMFCELGDEWAKPEGAIKGKNDQKKTKLTKTVEPLGVVMLNLGCLIVIIVSFSFVAMLINVVSSPLDSATWLVKEFL